jgi:hypothetical protein
MTVPFEGTALQSNIFGAIADRVRTMAPGLVEDLIPELTEMAEMATLYALAAQGGDPTAQDILKKLGERALILESTLAGRGQDALGAAINTGIMVAARVAGAILLGMK